MEFVKSKSFEHLVQAYKGEVAGKLLYIFLSEKMLNIGKEHLGNVFKQLANEEDGHVKVLQRYLPNYSDYALSDEEVENIKNSLEDNPRIYLEKYALGEKKAGEEIYPYFAQIASEEGFEDMSKMYITLARVELRHGELLAKELEALK